eukprot:Plantae.Rhodophyta-Hildenbrandia_rubra.ctg1328.p2 GENE.Plantae.Rhodophyta-Hildenbrandia_rubra.ctg1328~~Plantae.Rhodophyta-Hildenbrandia_rubra.ctg1328.p2  ORF type:complete len:160 (+),score=17.50 Plantae.Rhodophyta-Hildenbrandia_rubra.ctg1328:1531-2010(+)
MGKAERKHETIKLALSKLALANPDARSRWLAKFGLLLSSALAGNRIASSFELARGCAAGICGAQMIRAPREIIEAHKHLMAKRALHRILRAKSVTPAAASLLTPGAMICGCVESKKGFPVWKPCKVIDCDGSIARARSASKARQHCYQLKMLGCNQKMK